MSEEEKEYSTIKVSKQNIQRLKEIGRKGETYDDIISRLLDRFQRRRK